MRKIILLFATAACAVFFCGCKKTVDYSEYVSELRTNIYLYETDEISIKIYCGKRETPYNCDGIKGELTDFCEAYVYLAATYNDVYITLDGLEGEMSYLTAKGCYYLSASVADWQHESVDVAVTLGENTRTYAAVSVVYGGVIGWKDALNYVLEYRGELVASLTENYIFNGEFYVRLLYDDACYYFVGIIDRSGNTYAYLVDGATGKIIAEKTTA